MIVPFGPGTLTDTFARVVTANVAATLGQPIVIENRPGMRGRWGDRIPITRIPRSRANEALTLLHDGAVTARIVLERG